jgi:hypothetical protein
MHRNKLIITLTAREYFCRFGGPVWNAVSHTSEKSRDGTWTFWHSSWEHLTCKTEIAEKHLEAIILIPTDYEYIMYWFLIKEILIYIEKIKCFRINAELE